MQFVKKIIRKNGNDAGDSDPLPAIAACDYTPGDLTEDSCQGCATRFPSSVKIETDGSLFNSAKPVHAQIYVATGQDDWNHTISDEDTPWGHVCSALSSQSEDLEKLVGGSVRINGSNMDIDHVPQGKVLVLILPQFLEIITDAANVVEDVKAVLKVEPTGEIPANAKKVRDRGFVVLCSHRQRDKRCAITAPLMKKELDIQLRLADLYRDVNDDTPGGIRILYSNHVGGHKFAANVFVYLNDGTAVMMARMRPEHAQAIVNGTILKKVVYPDNLRACSKLQAYEW